MKSLSRSTSGKTVSPESKNNLSASTKRAREAWQQDNQTAIQAYNNFIAKNGCLSDEFRKF